MRSRLNARVPRAFEALGGGELGKLFALLFKERREVRETFLFGRDHFGGRARDEAFVAEFGFALLHLRFEALDFLREAGAFGGNVDFDLEHELEIADDRDGRERPAVVDACWLFKR